jgi:CPA1 family monovalent cation:H+ antiporter
MEISVLETSIILLSISCIVAIAVKYIKLPYTTALVIIGLVISFFHFPADIHLSHDLVFYIILPPLLFLASLNLDFDELKHNFWRIFAFSIPGVLISTFVIGYLMSYLLDMELIYGLLFGALISPTDPISVLAIFKEVGAPERLKVIVEGESLFNDGTGVVIFGIILAIVTSSSNPTVSSALLKFLKVSVGGGLIGFALGYIAYRILVVVEDHLLEVTITIVLTFGSFALAEIFHMSGVIAVVVAGLLLGNYGKEFSMSEQTSETVDIFWESIDFVINSFLFLMIGLELNKLQKYNFAELQQFIVPILITILVVVAGRAISIYPLNSILNRSESNKIPPSWSHVFVWGGLKGSIPIALVLGLPDDIMYKEEFMIISFGVVLFSLIGQSLTMKPLLRKLNITRSKS